MRHEKNPSEIEIAVISDLHIGKAACASDLRPAALAADRRRKMREEASEKNFLDDFREFVSENSIQPNYLVIPGDITDSCHPDEVEHAELVVRQLLGVLGLSEEKLIIVPGNHDVDWAVMKLGGKDPKGLRFRQRYEPIRDNELLLARACCDDASLLEEPYFIVREFGDAIFVCYNSAWHDKPDIAHHGMIHADHLAALKVVLEGLSRKQSKLRIFVAHHHPKLYSSSLESVDFSAMQGAEALLDLLNENRFDLLFHGHRHYPQFSIQSSEYDYAMAILGAGTFCASIPAAMVRDVYNVFHVVNVDPEPSARGRKGLVRSWAYDARKRWHECEVERTGIPHTNPYGAKLAHVELANSIEAFLCAELSDKGHSNWSSIKASDSVLQYVERRKMLRIVRELEQKHGWSVVEQGDDFYVLSE